MGIGIIMVVLVVAIVVVIAKGRSRPNIAGRMGHVPMIPLRATTRGRDIKTLQLLRTKWVEVPVFAIHRSEDIMRDGLI